MDFFYWFIIITCVQIIYFLGTWKLYLLAGRKSWKSAIPVYSIFVLMNIIKRPRWWVFLLFIPVVNLLMIIILWIETIRSFGKNSIKDSLLVIFSFGFYIFYLNYNKKTQYDNNRNLDYSAFGEWMSSMMFAIIAATLVHTYFMQPFIIPTGSLEKSLLIGDFLFVSKFHYGARVPTTPIALPMVHDTIPLIKTRSYLKKPQLPFMRLPGFQKIKRNEIVVFNWPADTVRQFFVKEKGVRKPIDKKSNYVKRCVGIPGDTLEIRDGIVFINNKKNKLPEWAKIQHTYTVYNNEGVSSKKLLKYGINDFERIYPIKNITQNSFNAIVPFIISRRGNTVEDFSVITPAKGLPLKIVKKYGLEVSELLSKKKIINTTLEKVLRLKKNEKFDSIVRNISKIKTPNESFFPNRITFDWNEDNFGPILIPKKGAQIKLNKSTYPLYKKIIEEYEGNKVIKSNGEFSVNNKLIKIYTFKQDYYWMMGDNRHRSEDSRFWGFVPENHVMGKPVFIWMSIDGFNDGFRNWKIRWDRLFSIVDGKGKRVSYFPHFLVIIVTWQIFIFLRKKRIK
ncbi:MAG: signal peptidase I [Flavobacteriaceae bacterium]|nr:signal peptidase I [Flavobacteriaceae bacterium]